MSRNNRAIPSNAPLLHPDHPRPVTRRDFLSTGLLSGLGMVMLPGIGSLVASRTAQAQLAGCSLAASGGMVPFICIDLAGGANMIGSNALAGGPLGPLDFLSTEGYSKLGLPADQTPDQAGQTDTQLGIPFHADSAFLRGILDKTTQATRDMVNGAVICARSANDTGNNPHNPMYGIARAGASGDLLGLIGTENSDSGGNSMAPMDFMDPALRPTKVDRPSDARGLVDTGRLVELLSQQDAGTVMRAVEDISAAKLDHTNEDDLVKDLVMCGYVKSTDQVSRFGDPDQLDPLQDPFITGQVDSIFTAAELDDSKFRKTASVMKLVCNSLAGAGTIEMGGYDYHGGGRATGEVRDFEAGQCMGAILEYSRLVSSPVMLYVFSDGSLSSNGVIDNSVEGRGKGEWTSDNSSTAASIMFVFDPTTGAARAPIRNPQIGYMRPSGDVETSSSIVADDVNLLAQAVVLNYLALHGREGDLASVLPTHGLGTPAEQDTVIALDKLPIT
ncbi:MAG: hypothetical protein ACQGVK_00715 [Myxococcota bacterium]